MRCEDYPCCGHEDGGCPNSDGTFNCCTCGAKLPIDSTSAMCRRCHREMDRREDGYEMGGDYDYSMNY
jgi:hypothetical protein